MCYERWHAHDLTSDQVHGRAQKTHQSLFLKKFLKTSILERLLLRADLQIKFHNLTIL